MKDETEVTNSTSLAVRQFVAVAFGWAPVHAPSQPFRVEAVTMEERYCLACFGARRMDVIRGEGREVAVCRCCGAEFGKGEMA